MKLGLFSLVRAKISTISFSLRHGGAFQSFGRGAYMAPPFRIDGAAHIVLGEKTVLQSGAWLYCQSVGEEPASITFGKGCVLGYNNHITSVCDVRIGDYVLTANNVYISDNLHSYENVELPILHQPIVFKCAVLIGSGSWLGENVCVIGASVGKNCVIGANSVVTRDIPDFSVAVGSPAKVIKRYSFEDKRWLTLS